MSVKTIFKVLIGTLVVLWAAMFLTEFFNVTIFSLKIKDMQKTAAYQAADLFMQETYRSDDGHIAKGTVNLPAVCGNKYTVDSDGDRKTNGAAVLTPYVSGTFYDSYKSSNTYEENIDAIYKELFGPGSYFYKAEVNNDWYGLKSTYYNLNLMSLRLKNGAYSPSELTWAELSNQDKVLTNIEKSTANSIVDNHITPANLGIPWVEPKTVNRMFRWNLAQLMSEGNPDNIRFETSQNTTGDVDLTRAYVYYKGFRVYAQYANITGMDMFIYDYADDKTPSSNGMVDDIKAGPKYVRTGFNGRWATGVNLDTTTPGGTDIKVKRKKIANYMQAKTYLTIAGLTDGASVGGTDADSSEVGIFLNSNISAGKTIVGNKVVHDNNAVAVLTLDYSCPVAYEGVTPLKFLMKRIFNKQVVEGVHRSDEAAATDENAAQRITDETNNMWGKANMSSVYESKLTGVVDTSSLPNGTVQLVESKDSSLAIPSTGQIIYSLVK